MRYAIVALIVGFSIQNMIACEKKDEGKAKKLIAWIAKKFEPKNLETLRQEVEELLQNGNRSEAIQIVACHRERNKDLWMHLLLSIPEVELNCRMHGESNVHEITGYGYYEDYFILNLLKIIKERERQLAESQLEIERIQENAKITIALQEKNSQQRSRENANKNDMAPNLALVTFLEAKIRNIEKLSHEDKAKQINATNNEISMLLSQWNKRRRKLTPEPIEPIVKNILPDYAGEIPDRIMDFYQMLTNPEYYKERSITLPRGILLYGPPGTGKTYLVKQLAKAVSAKFIERKGSSFVALYAGSGPKAIRDFFSEARNHIKSGKNKTAVLFY